MDPVLVTSDDWNGPCVLRPDMSSKRHQRVVVSIVQVGLFCGVVHASHNRVIILKYLHEHLAKDAGLIVVENDSSDFHRAVAQEAIILVLLMYAPWLMIMSPVRSGPRAWSKTGKRAVKVIEDISVGGLISNLDQD
jgi:hypothetical protein